MKSSPAPGRRLLEQMETRIPSPATNTTEMDRREKKFTSERRGTDEGGWDGTRTVATRTCHGSASELRRDGSQRHTSSAGCQTEATCAQDCPSSRGGRTTKMKYPSLVWGCNGL
jgi:hypothetical protein